MSFPPPDQLTLFDDQARLEDELVAELERNGAPLLRMPTGAGKTEVVISLVERLTLERVLFLVPGRVLLDQTRDRAIRYGVTARSSWPPNSGWPRFVRVMVATPVTAANRLAAGLMPDDVDLVVIDEAHHCYTAPNKEPSVVVSLVQRLGRPTVGMTATPWILNDKARFDHVFSRLVEADDYEDLVDAGRLAPLELLVPADARTVEGGETDSTGEYTARGIKERAGDDETVYTQRAVDLLATHQDAPPADWEQTIVYAISIGHAINLANLLDERGVAVGLVASRARNADEAEIRPGVVSDRDRAVEMFLDGSLKCLVNYAIVKEGFDSGGAAVIVITRPTASKALYRQMTGRGSRVAEGKDAAAIIDLTDNWRRHGPPMTADVYSLLPRSEWEGAGGDAVHIECEPWPLPTIFAGLRDDDVRPWCGWLKNWRTRRCPTCDGVQGDVCRRCGRFRRWSAFNMRGRKEAGERGNTCADCRIEERAAWEAEQVGLMAAENGGGGKWLYQQMTRTQRSYEGKSSAHSRYTNIGGRGVCGVEVKSSTSGWASWRPWLIVDEEPVELTIGPDEERSSATRDEALAALYDAIDERGLLPLVETKNRARTKPGRRKESKNGTNAETG